MFERKTGGVALLNKDHNLLIVKEIGSEKWGFPKGCLEEQDNNSWFNCALRELYEETLIDLKQHSYEIINVFNKNKLYIYLINIDKNVDIQHSKLEIMEYKWISSNNLLSDIHKNYYKYNSSIKCFIKSINKRLNSSLKELFKN